MARAARALAGRSLSLPNVVRPCCRFAAAGPNNVRQRSSAWREAQASSRAALGSGITATMQLSKRASLCRSSVNESRAGIDRDPRKGAAVLLFPGAHSEQQKGDHNMGLYAARTLASNEGLTLPCAHGPSRAASLMLP